jgi:peptide/nickel transport system permease protein
MRTTFILRRLFSMLLVWFGVTLLTFFIANVVPRDPVALRLGPRASDEAIQKWRHEYGLDQPLPQQYLRFMTHLFQGDLGVSIWSGRPITRDLADYIPATLELSFITLFLTILIGIPLGVTAASFPGSFLDRAIEFFASLGLALPLFWVGLLLQLWFYRNLGFLPLDSRIDLALGAPHHITGFFLIDSLLHGDMPRLLNSFQHLILPVVTLCLPSVGALARMTRASVIETYEQDYVRAARAKGISQERLMVRHVLRNALLPVVTVAGNLFNALLAGVFVVEAIFNWNGLGWYATRVILASDYGAIVSITLVIAVLCTLVNLVVDILYQVLDPRIQLA